MNHTEIVHKWTLCQIFTESLNLELEENGHRFAVFYNDEILYICYDVNELYAYLMGFSHNNLTKS